MTQKKTLTPEPTEFLARRVQPYEPEPILVSRIR